jgi:hypothetical protein
MGAGCPAFAGRRFVRQFRSPSAEVSVRIPVAIGLFVCGVAVLAAWAARPPAAVDDPFDFFGPDITLSAADHRALDRGEALVHLLPSHDREAAVFVAMPVHATAGRLIAWMRNIVDLKKSPVVQSIGRFSAPPRVEDLAGLRLDSDDLDTIRSCKPSSCGIKLRPDEIEDLQRGFGRSRGASDAVQEAFRRIVVARVAAYERSGAASPADALWDAGSVSDVDSFTYWSKEQFSGKPIVSATHVRLLTSSDPAMPEVIVAEDQIFATHYIDASTSVTAMLRGDRTKYLAYLNRSRVDVLGGIFGGVVRLAVEHRLKSQAPAILRDLRRRIETGDPPPR